MPQLCSGRRRWYQDCCPTCDPWVARSEKLNETVLEGLKVRRAQQAGLTWCDQRRSCGARSRRPICDGATDTFRA